MHHSEWLFPGSRWWKFDFHTHTPRSTDYGKGDPNEAQLKQRTPREWLLDFMRAGIDAVAVTDHNTGGWIDGLKAAYKEMETQHSPRHAEFRPLTIFPGVELSLGRVHCLAIFDPTCGGDVVEGLVGFARYRGERGNSNGACEASMADIAAEVQRLNGIFIPAHADKTTGVFSELRGNDLRPVLECDCIRACEIVDPSFDHPALYKERKLNWTRVLGSDSHHPVPSATGGGRFPGSHFTWVKMGRAELSGPAVVAPPAASLPASTLTDCGALTIESLRLALVDGNELSIRPSDSVPADFDPFALPVEFIESIEIGRSRFMGRESPERVLLNPFLNAVVGGRGSGKSTVIQFLRLCLRRDGELTRLDQNSEVRRSFERFRKVSKGRDDDGAVTADSRIHVVFRHQGERFRIGWPDVAGQPSVQDWNPSTQSWQTAKSQSVADRFPVRIFSQGQIALLAGEKSEALLEIINQAVNFTEWKSRWDGEERAFLTLRTRIRELEGKLQNRDRVVGSLDDVRRKLARFEEAEHAKVLKEFQTRSRQAKELESQVASAREKVAQLEALAQQLVPSDVGIGIFSESEPLDQEATANISRVREAIASAQLAVRNAAQRLTDDVSAEVALANQTAWHTAVTDARTAYDKLVTDLQAQGVQDPSEYGRLAQDSQRLELEVKGLESLNQSLTTLRSQATEKLELLQGLRREITVKRRDFLDRVLASNPYVRIELKAYGRESSTTAQSLRTVLRIAEEADKYLTDVYLRDDKTEKEEGVVAELLRGLPSDDTVAGEVEQRIQALKETLLKACLGQQTDLGSWFRQRIQKEYGQRPEYLDRILTWFPEDSLSVSYSAKGDGKDFRPITQGSAGQKAAAMLAFLLAYGDEPILVDQPEDDLDNHLIYGLVVRQIRENKQRRQIITVTHNPNIVVNGDAEMVHSLDFKSGQCRVTEKGSLQEAAVRDEICRVMEGGRDAFEQRYRRIGKGGSRV
jgi:energy-coupling factor transporter ATP-binding protein EcfA2